MNLLLSRLVWGTFFGLAAALLYALLSGTIRMPIGAAVFTGIAFAAGLAAGLTFGMLERLDVKDLLIRADKVLDSHELAGTAYQLDAESGKSIFSEAIIEDAGRLLAASDPARILGRPRMPLLPFVPVLLACALLLAVFPIDFAKVFAPKQAVNAEVKNLGQDLESLGKKLEQTASDGNLKRSYELSQELQKIGKEFQDQGLDQGEAADRLSELENRLAEQYEMKMQLLQPQNPSDGEVAREGGNKKPKGSGGKDSETQQQPPAQQNALGSDQESKDLADVLKMLSQNKMKLQEGFQGQGQAAQPGGPARGSGTGKGRESSEGQGGAQAPGGKAGEPGNGPESAPGTAPEPDKTGPSTEIARSDSGELLKAEAPVGEGDTSKLLMRAMPNPKGSQVPESELLKEYGRSAENALAREEVPLALKDYVKEYFITIGMLENDQGR
jgi:hypothetical protein